MAGIDNLKRTKKFDDRLFQSAPSWVVEEGAVSLSAAKFQSLASTAGQVTFQIQAPSKAVYLDRVVDWSQTTNVQLTVDMSLVTTPPSAPVAPSTQGPATVATPGIDFALCSSPLHALVSSIQATICDQQVSSNLAQNREIMQLLTDTPSDRVWRTYPAFLDVYTDYDDAYGTEMNPLAGFDAATDMSTVGNGAWPITWLMPNGTLPVLGANTYPIPGTVATVVTIPVDGSGIPYIAAFGAGDSYAVCTSVPLFFSFVSTEPLQLSPFIFRELQERRTGLSQLQNVNVVMNIQSAQQARLIRSTRANKRIVKTQDLIAFANGSPFTNSSLSSQFLSPPLSSELPYQPVNTVDYQNIQAYVYPGMYTSSAKGQAIVTTQTLSLNTIPDWLVIAVQPTSAWQTLAANGHYGTFYIPIVNVSLSWSNVSGLLSTQSQEQLFHICKANGIKMTWDQWHGYVQTSSGTKSLTGGPLILRPGVDLTLPPGQAAGQSNGQWTFQANVTVDLSHLPAGMTTSLSWGLQTTVIAINSGFFTTSSGTSRIVTGPVDGPSSRGGNPEDMYALANIPSSGPLYRPAEVAVTSLERLPGAGGGRPRGMSSRVRHRGAGHS